MVSDYLDSKQIIMRKKYAILICLLFGMAALIVPLYLYLRTRVIGSSAATSGDLFVVTQGWNGALDGYNTDLQHTDPQGRVTRYSLDGDDARYHYVPITVDEQYRIFRVTLSDNRVKVISY